MQIPTFRSNHITCSQLSTKIGVGLWRGGVGSHTCKLQQAVCNSLWKCLVYVSCNRLYNYLLIRNFSLIFYQTYRAENKFVFESCSMKITAC